jgi:serine protease
MNIKFAIVCLIAIIELNVSFAQKKFILTSKGKSKNTQSINNKIKKKVNIGSTEFVFASNLTQTEINELSTQYVVEEDFVASINWHLDRIDQRFLPLSQTPYKEANFNNSEIDIYVVDTGVDLNHPEFSNNNKLFGGNFVGDNIDTDCNGHGTHVASLALGKDYGVAKSANLFAVKVLGCSGSGSYSGIISAVEWITNNAKTRNKKAIVNMSLGGPASTALDTAITNSIGTGVYYVVAAGNSNANACNYSPARVPQAITVAASSSNDNKASFSNYGSCVDVYAPGVSLLAAWPNNNYAVLSGTSMSSPVTTGVLAVYLSRDSVSGYNTFLTSMTNNVIIKNPKRTLNKLVYV